MLVNIQKAIELTGVSRSTIQRHIKQGKLSRTDKGIDTAESSKINQADKSVSDYEKFLLSQVALLTNQLELANEREKKLFAILEHQAGADKSGGLFGRLFK
jgi:hypothetical protein